MGWKRQQETCLFSKFGRRLRPSLMEQKIVPITLPY
jgi:hypothetical protein